ncbi:hypothetical protein [Lentibacillus sp. CBA3610]|uniref:hypothetical protein n=1 Tax=Lentibacillus sp. CBA3610 TaxID=2518176 RepID=UPI0015953403|nr:hypothetical protein [Lentibacillus sp. CBA3610]
MELPDCGGEIGCLAEVVTQLAQVYEISAQTVTIPAQVHIYLAQIVTYSFQHT